MWSKQQEVEKGVKGYVIWDRYCDRVVFFVLCWVSNWVCFENNIITDYWRSNIYIYTLYKQRKHQVVKLIILDLMT